MKIFWKSKYLFLTHVAIMSPGKCYDCHKYFYPHFYDTKYLYYNIKPAFLNCFHVTKPVLLISIFLNACSILSSSSGLVWRDPKQQIVLLLLGTGLTARGFMETPSFLGVSWGRFSTLSLMVDQSTRLVFTANSKKFSLVTFPFLSQRERAAPSSNSTWKSII